MSAATATRDSKRSDGRVKSYPVAGSTTVYGGTLVAQKSDGYLASIAHGTSGMRFAGVMVEKVDNSAGADAAKSGRVWQDGEHEFAYNGGDAAQSLVGQKCYAVDNQTVDEDPSVVTNEYLVGTIVEVISTTKVRVRIEPSAGARAAAQAAITSLTDNTGGTANNTLTALGGLTTLTDSTGLSGTHDDTLAATAAPTTLTDSTGLSGTHDDTLAATTVPAAITGGESPTEAEHNAVLTLLGVMVQNQSDVAQKVIELVTLSGVLAQNGSDVAQKVIEVVADVEDCRNNFADVAAKIEEILDALRAAGIIAQ